ncbi:LOW QUALITY PROTEIN: hypothetical protein OSB04_006176 [Centaurea solstitialis]|uniref:Reverse transcriptase zinc-binding domain-containing protein n=1 Tax=Centaurea solstitialis TaxID=347529 RepID=A0AA38TV84_9ASTR|nr:LOW QUALITY PROTEIN: hypothetical protein OSB04_006176 [Centaurea solstitialis]
MVGSPVLSSSSTNTSRPLDGASFHSIVLSRDLSRAPEDTDNVRSSNHSPSFRVTDSIDLSAEVRNTMGIGEMVGFQMAGYDNELRKLISKPGALPWNPRDFCFGPERRSNQIALGEQMLRLRIHGEVDQGVPFLFGTLLVLQKLTLFVAKVFWISWIGLPSKCGFINTYAPQNLGCKKRLWVNVAGFLNANSNVFWIVFGDFNDVRSREERRRTSFSFSGARAFNEFILEAGLSEIRSRDRKYTRIVSSVDSSSLTIFFRSGLILSFLSDHCPLVYNAKAADFGLSYFKFYNSWIHEANFSDLILNSWHEVNPNSSLSPTVIFMLKLKKAKSNIKNWRSDSKKTKYRDLADLKGKMEDIDLKDENIGISPMEIRQRQETLIQSNVIERANKLDLEQRTTTIDGEEISRFFHGIINRNRRSNFSHGLSINGSWVIDPHTITQAAYNFFANKFSNSSATRPSYHSNNFKKLSPEQASFLEAAIPEVEIKGAVWDCGLHKAPGPDGFSFGFLKHYWGTIKGDLIAAVKRFEAMCSFDKGCNSSFIALIPKNSTPLSLHEYRPISLLTVAKILAKRVKMVIGALIEDEQTAFIKERCILDGPLIISLRLLELEVYRQDLSSNEFRKKVETMDPRMFKVYFGFRFNKWESVERIPDGKTNSTGRPVGPFLFIIAAEGLNIAIKEACGLGVFKGVNLPNLGPLISHLQFAGDIVFLGGWFSANLSNLIRIMRCFHLFSGLKINLNKSNLLGIGVDFEDLTRLANRFHCKPSNFPINYLGLPLGCSMNRVESWESIINKFTSKLSKWKSQSLSHGGRLVLLKSVLGSLGVYFFSIFKAPQKIEFLLGDQETMTKRSLGTRFSPKKVNGGLGVGSLKALNLALMTKWWWWFKTETDSLWKRVIQALHGVFYLGGGGFDGANLKGKHTGVNIPINSWFQTQNGSSNSVRNWNWALDSFGFFTVSSLRKAFDDHYLQVNLSSSFCWNNSIPTKVNILAWRLSHSRLPTKLNLVKRGMPLVSLTCPLCNNFDENEKHLFKDCTFSNTILKDVCQWWNINVKIIYDHPLLFDWAYALNLKGDRKKVFNEKARNDKSFRTSRARLISAFLLNSKPILFIGGKFGMRLCGVSGAVIPRLASALINLGSLVGVMALSKLGV